MYKSCLANKEPCIIYNDNTILSTAVKGKCMNFLCETDSTTIKPIVKRQNSLFAIVMLIFNAVYIKIINFNFS
jgi:hypothetical protein